MLYTAVRIYQAGEEHELHVFTPGFKTITEAAKYANWESPVLRYRKEVGLFSDPRVEPEFNPPGPQQIEIIRQEDTKVFRLKTESKGKGYLTQEDFEEIQVDLADFADIPDLSGTFESQSYGVTDDHGKSVNLAMLKFSSLYGI